MNRENQRKTEILPPSMDQWVLVDNGSVRAEAVRFLRKVASDLSLRVKTEVLPVSYNHSHRINPEALDGQPAQLLADAAREAHLAGNREIGILPFFLSGGGGILKMVAREATLLKAEFPGIRFWRTPFLTDGWGSTDTRIADALRDRIDAAANELRSREWDLVLVDHGSPYPEAAALRNFLGGQVASCFAGDQRIRRFAVASMERRPGAFYAFNEPLLETVLKEWGGLRPVVLGQLFLGPGKHAGPDGDIAGIARSVLGPAGWTQTRPIGDHPAIIETLAQRMGAPLNKFGLDSCRLDERERCPCCRFGGK